MNIEQIKQLDSYEVINHEKIDEVNSDAWLLRHKRTGARIAILENDDDNKVFNIGFRTPVSDDTGVPHIIEHTVLCGSKKYPVKDPFMEVVKGSLNTFLNAMTYSDKTVYPVASCNDKDFVNLMSIYMDSVFNPNIYNEEKIFKQEGWHYEIDSPEGELKYNGVVYSEMKGAFSSVDDVVGRVNQASLFPDTTYGNESGGDPEFIPALTYEDYLDFHRRYYHPSNSYIYLYGNMDAIERLKWMDEEYLGKYDYLEIDSTIKIQEPFSETKYVEQEYAIADEDNEEENYIYSKNYVIGTSDDIKLYFAIQVLEYALMESPGAPLKQALIDEGIGKDIFGQYDTSIRQPMYSIISKYSKKEDKEKFEKLINDTLTNIVSEGIDKKTLKAGLSYIEFKTKEADFGRTPKGLMFGLEMMSSWLYDDNEAFTLLKSNSLFDELRDEIETDYFESLVKKYFLYNTHSSVVTMVPKKGLTQDKEEAIKLKLAQKKASMTAQEIEQLIRETKELKEYQKRISTKEELMTIPLLELSDINKNPRPIASKREVIDDITFIHTDTFTNGIGYLDIVFDCSNIPCRYHNYLGLLKSILGCMDTTNMKYTQLNTAIDLELGGFSFDSSIYTDRKSGETIITGEMHAKMLYEKIEKAFEFTEEIVVNTQYTDFKRLREILEELKSRINAAIIRSGNVAAMLRAMSYYSKGHYVKDQMTGYSFYKFLEEILEDYDNNRESIAQSLKETVEYVFGKNNIIVNYAGDDESYELIKKKTFELREHMYNTSVDSDGWEFVPEQKNEAIITPGQVQYVSRVGNYREGKDFSFDGSFMVLSNILSSEYLWKNIREQGGAYGCGATFTRAGDAIFTSYRDPHLKKTSEVFLKAADYIEKFEVDEREMRKYIIGTISSMDTPLNPSDLSSREFNLFITKTDYEQLAKERREVLSTTVEDIRKLAPLVRKAMGQNNICVVGGKTSIEKDKELFGEIKTL